MLTKTRSRTRIATRTMTRTELLQSACRPFFRIAEELGCNMNWFNKNLEVVIHLQLIVGFEIVVFNEAEPIGGIEMVIDWDTHHGMVDAYGEHVDVSEIEEGRTYASIEECIEVARKYVVGLMERGGGTRLEVWCTKNSAKVRSYGDARYHELLNTRPRSPEEKAEIARRRQEIRLAKAAKGQSRSSTFSDLSEASIGAW